MDYLKRNIFMVGLLLMICSSIANILFYVNMISKFFVNIAFILVIICGIVMNFLSSKDQKGKLLKRSFLSIVIMTMICITWIISYSITC